MQLEFRKITPFGHALPPNGHSADFRICQLDIKLPQQEIIYTDGRTDGQTGKQHDGRTDRRTDRRRA